MRVARQAQHDTVSAMKKFLTFTLEKLEMKPTALHVKLERKNPNTTLTIRKLYARLFKHSSGLELDAIQLEEVADVLDLKLCLIPKHITDIVKQKWGDVFKLAKISKQLPLYIVSIPRGLSSATFKDRSAYRKFFEYRQVKFGQAHRLVLLRDIADGKTKLTAQQYSALIKVCELCGDFKMGEPEKEPHGNGGIKIPKEKSESEYILGQQPRLLTEEMAEIESE